MPWLMRLCKLLVLSSAITLLAACMTQPQPQIITGVSNARSAYTLHRWQARGRIGINAAQQSGSGGFTWAQQAELSEVQLRGPVGIGAFSLSLDGSVLTIRGSDGAYYDADAALDELQLRLGTPLPVASLRYWLLGLAAPGEPRWLDDQHNQLEQDGWQVTYEVWTTRGELRLPVRLALTRADARIRIVVQSWNLDS